MLHKKISSKIRKNNKNKLALFGGSKVRKKPFCVEPLINGEEKKLVLNAIKKKNFSRYIGSYSENLISELEQKSTIKPDNKYQFHYLGGPNIKKFCYDISKKFKCDYVIPVNSATTALSVALAANNIGPGDEVIVPAISYSATASSILLFNSIPVFVDVEPKTFCINVEKIEEKITKKTKAILAVHLMGNVAEIEKIQKICKKYKLKFIEDTAQAPGAKYKNKYLGTFGDAGVLSLQQSKNIMTGEGGIILTNNKKVARKSRLIINHGEVVYDKKAKLSDLENIVGCNFRMTEITAALGIAQLKKLDKVNIVRKNNGIYLREKLKNFPGLEMPIFQDDFDKKYKVYPHIFVIKYDKKKIGIKRDAFIAALRAEGIPVGTGYVRPMYANPIFLKKIAFGKNGCPWTCNKSKISYSEGMCPTSEKLLNEEFLWFYHIAYSSTKKEMDDIFRAINKIYANLDFLKNYKIKNLAKLAYKGQDRLKLGKNY